MKKLLLLFTLALVSLGSQAAPGDPEVIFQWPDADNPTVTLTETHPRPGQQVGPVDVLDVSTPGALANWVTYVTGDYKSSQDYDPQKPFMGLGQKDPQNHEGNDKRTLKITGTLNAADFAKLKSSLCGGFSRYPCIDLSEVTLANDVTKAMVMAVDFSSNENPDWSWTETHTGGPGHEPDEVWTETHDHPGAGAEFIRLPDGFTSADDVALMANMKNGKNNNLKVVGSYDDTNSPLDELALQSFEANQVQTFRNHLMPAGPFNAKSIRMSGIYGGIDFVTSLEGFDRVFTGSPAVWDFSNATFETCTVAETRDFANSSVYWVDDPFEDEENEHITGLSNFQTNAFYYFNTYPKDVVEITLPQTMTELPPFCLQQLATDNYDNYKLVTGKTDAEILEEFPDAESSGVPIANLVIPNSVVTVGYECAYISNIQNITFGTGLKLVQGGAFKQIHNLTDLEFSPGISDCVLGHDAFQLCYDLKHVVLCEGIVSLGAGCFQNSQQMESIRLPETLQYIGNRCFDNNLALSSITIPSNVDKIGKRAFTLTALTDIYLTTTDPSKIPAIYTAGTSWGDTNATFGVNQLYGNNGTPDSNQINDPNKYPFSTMTWDEAAIWYYTHANCIATLHFPEPLANKVMSFISEDYDGTSADGFGLPSQRDANKRANGLGEVNLGVSGQNGGRFTRDGWVQFLLMKAFKTTGETKVYSKEYDDVWNTMCFPFDLTDEQLAAAFNEGFNIVDFSGVEIIEPEQSPENKKTLVLHFNTVALTTYKDSDGNVYQVIGREPQTQGQVTFYYNVYLRDGVEYHHVVTGKGDAASTKTKTFAPGSSLQESASYYDQNKVAVFIDGYLASAGHPYMIHPNVGVSPGQPKVACHLAGITWEPVEKRDSLFNARKRSVNLGVAMHDANDEDKPDADNYMQRAYTNYSNQLYEFKGNWKAFNDVAELPDEPQLTVQKPQPPVEPKQEPDEVINPGPNPGEPSQAVLDAIAAYTADDRALYDILRKDFWPNETEITCGYNDGSSQANAYSQNSWRLQNHPEWGNPYGQGDEPEKLFNKCKSIFNNYKVADVYITWVRRNDNYQTYLAEKAYWDQWQADDGAAARQAYQDALDAYNAAVEQYERDLQAWKNTLAEKHALILIPENAYFLGRRGTGYPKYYRETSTNTSRTTGLWTQYTAIIEPNESAVNGIEAELDGKTTSSNGMNMVFDENFLGQEVTPTAIEEIIEEAEEKGQKVEYLKVVYSINGQIVREGTSLEGLPKGVYIVNGKKYFVR